MDAGDLDVAGDRSGLAIDFHQPSRRQVRLIARLRGEPHRTGLCLQREGLPERRPLAQIGAGLIEPLHAAILPIGDIDEAFVVDLNRVRQAELPRSGASCSPLTNLLPVPRIFENAGIGVAVRDEEMAVLREGDVGRPAEIVAARSRLAADSDFHDLRPVGREFDHLRARRVGRPDIAARIDANGVRHHVESVAPRSHDLAVAVHDHHRVGLVAALQQVHETVSIRGNPRHHAHRPAVARRIRRNLTRLQRQPMCTLDHRTQFGCPGSYIGALRTGSVWGRTENAEDREKRKHRRHHNRRRTSTHDHFFAPKANTVFDWYRSPGRRIVDGKAGWLGESGKCCVSRQRP